MSSWPSMYCRESHRRDAIGVSPRIAERSGLLRLEPYFEPLVFAPNIARHLQRLEPLPFQSLMGTYVCPSDPATLGVNEVRLRAFFERYPEADSVCLWMSEGVVPCLCSECQAIYDRYLPHFAGVERAFQHYEVTGPDTLRFDIAFLDLFLRLREGQRQGVNGQVFQFMRSRGEGCLS